MASQDGDDREAVALILFSLKALSIKIKNSVKKTLRLASQDGDDREAVALILFSLKSFLLKLRTV
ncbi:hypothetical protein CQ056_04460 [Peribacillus simplex]|nr:hypothetical protein CQ056_04460 [Peribacillus simplex]